PANGSLARSGLFLAREVKRLVPAPEKVTFICHSAGGLVFRWYAERQGGGFDRAELLAGPNAGRRAAELRLLVDLAAFAGRLREGCFAAVSRSVAEGQGEVGLDLRPDSLFLRYLGSDRRRAARYHVYTGTSLDWQQALLLQL